MIIFQKLYETRLLTPLVLSVALLSGCLDKQTNNTGSVTYTPEERPLGVIAGKNIQVKPGEKITLDGRLVGTAKNGESIVWEKLEGPDIADVTDWTKEDIAFTAPSQVDGILTYRFQIKALDSAKKPLKNADGTNMVAEIKVEVYDPASLLVLEVEDTSIATLNGVKAVSSGDAKYIMGATGSHTSDVEPGQNITYTLKTGTTLADGKQIKAGFYSLYVKYAIPSDYGSKQAQVEINGVKETGLQFEATGTWKEYALASKIQLSEGVNTIVVGGGWNYYRIDSIKLLPGAAPAKPSKVPETLVNANATSEAKDLMKFLISGYGTKTITGQTEFMNYGDAAQTGLRDFNKTVEITGGAAPAIVAFDYMDYSSSRVKCGSVPGTLTEDMIKAHRDKNLILSPMWHWNAPTKLVDSTCKGSGDTAWYKGFYSNATTFNLSTALADENSDDYKALIADIDLISAELKKFQDAGIPLLWRPLHEAEGKWFWWGNAGSDALKKLWILMYDRMTKYHNLNNLIWVYTGADKLDATWYPGNDVVDVVGYDGYDGKNASSSFKTQYKTLMDRFNGKKLVALTETGTIPDVKAMQTQNSWWAYYVTWNSGGDFGPVNADTSVVKATYAYENTLTLKDVPGGRTKVEAGIWAGFETPTVGWGAQLNWSDTAGISVSPAWSASGTHSLSVTKDLTAYTPTDVAKGIVLQTYPAGGIDVKGKTKLTLVANAIGSGAATTAKLFIKDKDGVWKDAGAVSVVGGVELSIDLTGIDQLSAIGVQFEGADATSTAASFHIDNVLVDGKSLYDFEPNTGWDAQVSWSSTNGGTIMSSWKNTGAKSFGVMKDLSKESAPSNVVLQAYPEGGIDIATASGKTLSVSVNTTDSGSGTTAYLFVKHGKDQAWAATTPIAITGATTIEIDVTGYDTVAGLGVVFENFDKTQTAAKFYVDTVKLDSKVLFDFENTGAWEFQVNWSGASGLRWASDWSQSGGYSLAGTTQLNSGDDNIILQTYPAGNLLLGQVSKIKVAAHAKDADAGVTAQLFAKDKNGNWKDGGEVPLVDGTANLSLDISGWDEVQGLGVRFQHPGNFTTESNYYIDDVSFE